MNLQSHRRFLILTFLLLTFLAIQPLGVRAENPLGNPSTAPVTLVLGINEHPYTSSLIPLIPEFEKATGITVKVETFYPEEKWLAARNADVSSGTGHFDVMMLDMVLTQYARAGWIEPLDDYFNNPALIDLADYDMNDIPIGLRKYGMVDGRTYGIPVDADAEILYYRQDLFDQLEIRAPTTMDELYLTALKLDHPGKIAGICMRGRNIFSVINFSGLLWSFGGQHFDDVMQPRRAMFNQPAGVTALSHLARLLQDAGPQGVGDYSWEECARDFQQGKVAMYIDSSLLMSTFEDPNQSTVRGRVGYAPLPKGPNGSVSNSFDWMMGINAASKNKQAAFQFIAWASRKDISLRTAIKNGSSARESVWRSPEFLSAFPHPTWADVTVAAMKTAGPEAPFPRVTQIDDFLSNVGGAINKVITGNADAQTALDAAAVHMDALLTPGAPRAASNSPIAVGSSKNGFRENKLFSQFNDPTAPTQRTINAILQDQTGFIWFGTDDGLYKYDGNHFTRFKQIPQNPVDSVGYNFISALSQDRNGNLWIGTWGGGLSQFDPITNKFTLFVTRADDPNSLSQMQVRTLYMDHAGILWIGTFEGGLDAFDPSQKKFTHYRHSDNADSLGQNTIWALYEDHTGALWIGTANGLDRLDATRQKFTHYRNNPNNVASLSNDTVMAIFEDSANILWVGTRNGLNRFDREQGRFVRYQHGPNVPESLGNNVIMSIHQDSAGILWIGTEDGLDALDPKLNRFTHNLNQPGNLFSLIDNRVRTIFQDRAGLLWIGTYHGISTLHTPPKFALYQNTADTLNSNYIRALLSDPDGTLWIGTNDGLARYNRSSGVTQFYLHDPQNPASISAGLGINVIYRDHQGNVWLGGWGTGLERLNPRTGKFKHYLHQENNSASLSHNTIFAIHQDHQGILWIGTANGLNRLDPATEKFTAFYHDANNSASLAANDVRVIFEDETGTLWLGSRFNGITRFDPTLGKFQVYAYDTAHPTSLADNTITTILQDRSGAMWFGTAAGLSRLDRQTNTFSNIPINDQFPGEYVRCVLQDQEGRLWASTKNGLGQYMPESKTFTRFTPIDGLQEEFFNDAACAQAGNGEMFFGGANGINSFYSAKVQKDTYTPPIVLTNLLISDKPVEIGPEAVLQKPVWQTNHLNLSYLQNTLTFEFSVLDYANPDQNLYRYQLEGYDKDWHPLNGKPRIAEYANLPPGDYIFRVQATNHDQVWSANEIALAITLMPPWWDAWLFRVGVVIGCAGLVFGVYRWRTLAIRRQAKHLETLVHTRTAELHESERAMTTLIANLPGIAYRCQSDPSRTMEFISHGCRALTGYPPAALIHNTQLAFGDLIHPEDKERIWLQVQASVDTRESFQLTYRIITCDKETKWVWEQGQGIFDEQGKLLALEGLITDITERKNAEEAVSASEQRLQDVIANNIDGMIVVDSDGVVRFINPAATSLLGKPRAELEGQLLGLPITRTDGTATEVNLLRVDNQIFPSEMRATVIQWANQPACLITLHDITERKQLEQELHEQATTDELTHIANRRQFMETAQKEYQRALRFNHALSLAIIDLDHFKQINDTYGHATGDQALILFTQICQSYIRTVDLFARLGGDEFALLLPETDLGQAMPILERLRQTLNDQSLNLDGKRISITLSVGLAALARDDTIIDMLLARADQALYRAKEGGRNHVVIEQA